jgi:type VI secretion system protein ImpE
MSAEELLRAGRLEESLACLQEAIRAKPEDSKLRLFLFQLLCVLGQWERSLTQLEVLGQINAQSLLLTKVYRPVVQCEMLREEIFAGRRAPLIFGEPEPWVSFLAQVNELVAHSEFAAAATLRNQAMEAAPAAAGTIDGVPFAWLADADSRLGPILEVILSGRYFWVPLYRVSEIQFEAPTALRDVVWAPASFQWANGGQAAGHVPVRYPGTQGCPDGPLRLARRTEWIEQPGDFSFGLGQRLLASDQGDYPLLDVRLIEFAKAEVAASPVV